MIRIQKLRYRAISTLTVCLLSLAVVTVGSVFSVARAEAYRAEIANPLKAAQDLAKNKKYSEAMAKLKEADAVSGKTAGESAAIEQMRTYIASVSGDTTGLMRSYESQLESGRLSGAEQLRAIQALATLAYQVKDYNKAMTWAQRYIKEGGTDPQVRNLPMQLAYLSGDCQSVIRQVQGDIRAAETAGRVPSEDQLQLLANCASKQKDNVVYLNTLEKLVTHYPTKDYWKDLLNRIERRPGFNSILGYDVYRLRLVTGNVTTANDYMELAQLALQQGQAAEAKRVIDMGFAAGVLGTGADVNRHNRLRALAEKKVAEDQANAAKLEAEAQADADGTNLLKIGHNYIAAGRVDQGISLMEQAMKKSFRRPEYAKLSMGTAYIEAGQRQKGIQILKSVGGNDGTTDIARLWMVVHPQQPTAAAAPAQDKKTKGSKK